MRNVPADGQALAGIMMKYLGPVVYPDSKVHGANMGPTGDLSVPSGPHVRPMNLAIRVYTGPEACIKDTTAIWRCRKPLNQWQCSFQMKSALA